MHGDPHAELVARRAAEPLLRRPWHALSLVTSADGTAALGFAGEAGGVTVDKATGCAAALAGELYGPVRTGPEAAEELLSYYLRGGPDVEPPDGSFSAALWDSRTKVVVLLTDRFASRPVFVSQGARPMVAASELKAILAAGFPATLDLQAVAEVLAYRYTFGGKTLIAGVRELSGGTTLILDGPICTETRRWRYQAEPGEGDDLAELVDEFGRLFGRSVAARLDGSESLALSGGLDSRCIAADVSMRGFGGIAATFGVRGSRELALAARVAAEASVPHRVLWLEPGHIARWVPACVWLSDGRKNPFSTHEIVFRSLRSAAGSRALLTGTRGDDVVRLIAPPEVGPTAQQFTVALHEELSHGVDASLEAALQPEFADALRGRAAAGLANHLATEGGDRQAQRAEIEIHNAGWITSPALYDDYLSPRDPFDSHELVEFCRKLPYPLRLGGRLQRGYLSTSGSLSRVPHDEEATLTRAARRVLGRTHARSPYHADLLGASAAILEILVEPRTLARGQIREQAARQLIARLGRGRPFHLLSGLIRLEIFQRQFIDGDGQPDLF